MFCSLEEENKEMSDIYFSVLKIQNKNIFGDFWFKKYDYLCLNKLYMLCIMYYTYIKNNVA